MYKVKEYNLENKKLIYLSGESIGENAHYLLTVIIQDYKGLTQVVLRAYSNKKYGLNGFINEKTKNIRHLVESVQSAKEIGIIENKKVINIIDSVLQRTKFEIMGDGGTVNVNVKESLMIRNDIEGVYSGNKVIAPILDNKQSAVTGTDVNFDTIGNVQTLEFQKIYEYLVDVARKGCKIYNTGLELHNKKERQKLRDQKIIVTYCDVLKIFGEKFDSRKA